MALSEEEQDELDRLQLEKLRREDAAIRRQEEEASEPPDPWWKAHGWKLAAAAAFLLLWFDPEGFRSAVSWVIFELPTYAMGAILILAAIAGIWEGKRYNRW